MSLTLTQQFQEAQPGLNQLFTTVGSAQQFGLGDMLLELNTVAGTAVSSLNGLIGAVTLSAGSGITITPSGNTLTIAASGSAPLVNYGNAYANSISQVVTVASAAVFYQVPGSLTTGPVNNFTFTGGNGLRANVAGLYFVSFSMSLLSGTANETLQGCLMVNGTAVPNIGTSETEASVANHPGCVSASGIITLALNDIVSLAVMNETAAHNITVTQASLTIRS